MIIPDRPSILCVDIGGSSTKIGVFQEPQSLHFLESIPTQGPADVFADALCAAVERGGRLIEQQGSEKLGLGVAVAGFVNEERDRMVYNSNLFWLQNYPLRDRLRLSFNGPIDIETDSNTAALAEYHLGVGEGSERFLCLTVGTGIGVGMIVHDEPLRFAYGCMGDAGHIIVQPNGPLCPCGGRGCAEVLLSAPLMAEQYRLATGREGVCTLRDVIVDARSGERAAITMLEHAGEWLGIATASLANTFYPDRIAFAGGLAEAGDIVLDAIRSNFEYSASKFARERVTIRKADLGAMATLTGAAFPVLHRIRQQAAGLHGPPTK